jgi:7-cyano-7-deazaguanine synthase
MSSRDLAVVLSSGSVNSAVAALLAAQKYRVILLHAKASEANAVSCEAAHRKLAEKLHVLREITIALPSAGDLGGMPAGSDHLQAPTTRNRLRSLLPLLGLASQFAFMTDAVAIYCGLRVGGDATSLTDATQLQQIYTELLQLIAGDQAPELVMPLVEMEIHQVVDLGAQLNTPFEATWSCLQSGEVPCGQCMGCRLRMMAFAQAQHPDPLPTIR